MTAAARDVDAFLADLDSVLAASTAPIPAPAPGPESTPEPDATAPIRDVGPDTAPAPTRRPGPSPAPPAKDWWSDVYKDDTADQDTFTGNTPPPAPSTSTVNDDPPPDEPEAQPGETTPEEAPTAPVDAKQKPSKPRLRPSRKRPKLRRNQPAAPRTAWDTDPHGTRQSLVEAWARTPYRLKWLAYHASAAYLGWSAGLVDYATEITAWTADGHTEDWQAWIFYALGAATFLLYRRTRGQWWPVAWCAAVPATSTVVGVLLYAPTP